MEKQLTLKEEELIDIKLDVVDGSFINIITTYLFSIGYNENKIDLFLQKNIKVLQDKLLINIYKENTDLLEIKDLNIRIQSIKQPLIEEINKLLEEQTKLSEVTNKLFCLNIESNGNSRNVFFSSLNKCIDFINPIVLRLSKNSPDYLTFTFQKISPDVCEKQNVFTINYIFKDSKAHGKDAIDKILKIDFNEMKGIYINNKLSELKVEEELTVNILEELFKYDNFTLF